MSSKIVNVCIAFSDTDGNYIYSAATTILSVVLHASNDINIHVFSDATLTQRGKALLEAIAHSQRIEILFHFVDVELLNQIAMPEHYEFGIGSFYRFFIPEVIGSGIAIYVDCDVLCLTNIYMLSTQIRENETYYAGVVQDSYVSLTTHLKTALQQRGFNHKKYFNSGVLVLNCDKINELFNSFSKTLIKTCYDSRNFLFIDQDALNMVFSNIKIHWMDVNYNYMMNIASRYTQDEKQLEGKILHFAGINPWIAPELPPTILYANYYWKVMQIYKSI